MKKKILLSVFVIFLVLVLIGCAGVVPPPLHNAEEILRAVDNYWLALSNKQYELAKTYCIPYGDAYYAVEDYQILSSDDYITINWTAYLNYVETNGNNSEVNINLTLTVTVCLEEICSTQTEKLYNHSMYLNKIDGIWKLK